MLMRTVPCAAFALHQLRALAIWCSPPQSVGEVKAGALGCARCLLLLRRVDVFGPSTLLVEHPNADVRKALGVHLQVRTKVDRSARPKSKSAMACTLTSCSDISGIAWTSRTEGLRSTKRSLPRSSAKNDSSNVVSVDEKWLHGRPNSRRCF